MGHWAQWMDTIGEEHLARAKRILDLWHLERQMSRGFEAVIDDHEGLTRQRAQLSQLLRRGRADRVLTVLRGLGTAHGPAGQGAATPKALTATITYIEPQRQAIVHYEAEQAVGEHVGSGAVEKAGDLVVNRRFKGRRGMRWRRGSAEGILAPRILHLNRDGNACCQKRRNRTSKAADPPGSFVMLPERTVASGGRPSTSGTGETATAAPAWPGHPRTAPPARCRALSGTGSAHGMPACPRACCG